MERPLKVVVDNGYYIIIFLKTAGKRCSGSGRTASAALPAHQQEQAEQKNGLQEAKSWFGLSLSLSRSACVAACKPRSAAGSQAVIAWFV